MIIYPDEISHDIPMKYNFLLDDIPTLYWMKDLMGRSKVPQFPGRRSWPRSSANARGPRPPGVSCRGRARHGRWACARAPAAGPLKRGRARGQNGECAIWGENVWGEN